MKNTGNIFLGLAAAGMLFATSFKPETGRKDVVYVPLIIDEIVDHTMVVDSTQSQSISIPEGYPIDPIFLKKSIIKSSQFGKRFHPIFRKWKMHAGIDMGAKKVLLSKQLLTDVLYVYNAAVRDTVLTLSSNILINVIAHFMHI